MAWYRTITHNRHSRVPYGREVGRATFEAADEASAVAEARERARLLPQSHVLALFDLDENRIECGEGPEG
ncbi:MAG TPA: hypothetical protein VGN38_02965 [Caulobacteraceae bacterium]|jgi:hypothetical protein|nr:hypothetical protein [Caulobacteraceae bacterium]